VKDPADALAEARRRAAARNEPADVGAEPWSLGDAAVSTRRLAEWAIIAPEQGRVYSTRRFGRPITAIKRLMIRMLGQYLGQMTAQQSRFNAQLAAHLIRLEERVQALEEAAGAERTEPPR
jgi:hypothetical protein